MALNYDQSNALKHIVDGHNVLLMGSAGTGKSYLIKEAVRAFENLGKNVYVTATTGIVSSHYKQATTIHRWSGIGDGRYSVQDLTEIIMNNKQYTDVKSRIMETDVLFIDECSMMSKRLFDGLNSICKIKNPSLLFGGIQIVMAGDFKQLAPVPNILYGDEGDYCFTSEAFHKVFPHQIELKSVIRQHEAPLIKAIEECAVGSLTPETKTFIEKLSRPLPDKEEKTTMLFSTNEQVDGVNRRCILNHPGELYEFSANDCGEKRYLNKITVPKVLWLKVGAPVILMRNLSDKLVNGLQGHISDISKEHGPVVKFGQEDIKLPKVKCTVFSPSRNREVAIREQYPLKLAFAISIHKSQGMTINRLEVNCKGIFKPGQLAVALGRSRTTDELRVVNFTPSVCIPQPHAVQHFLSRITSSPCLLDKSCCQVLCCHEPQKMIIHNSDMLPAEEDYDHAADPEFDEEFDDQIKMIDEIQNENVNVDLPNDLNIENILESIREQHVVTTYQECTNKILETIDMNKINNFAKNEYVELKEMLEIYLKDGGKISSQCEFYSKVYIHQTSIEFRMNCMSAFDHTTFTNEHLHICFNISSAIRKYFIEKKVHLLKISNRQISKRSVTNASLSRIRYVGGYCVAKTHNKYLQKKEIINVQNGC